MWWCARATRSTCVLVCVCVFNLSDKFLFFKKKLEQFDWQSIVDRHIRRLFLLSKTKQNIGILFTNYDSIVDEMTQNKLLRWLKKCVSFGFNKTVKSILKPSMRKKNKTEEKRREKKHNGKCLSNLYFLCRCAKCHSMQLFEVRGRTTSIQKKIHTTT